MRDFAIYVDIASNYRRNFGDNLSYFYVLYEFITVL